MQYVGKLMREPRCGTVRSAHRQLRKRVSRARHAARCTGLERWRDELLADDDALDR